MLMRTIGIHERSNRFSRAAGSIAVCVLMAGAWGCGSDEATPAANQNQAANAAVPGAANPAMQPGAAGPGMQPPAASQAAPLGSSGEGEFIQPAQTVADTEPPPAETPAETEAPAPMATGLPMVGTPATAGSSPMPQRGTGATNPAAVGANNPMASTTNPMGFNPMGGANSRDPRGAANPAGAASPVGVGNPMGARNPMAAGAAPGTAPGAGGEGDAPPLGEPGVGLPGGVEGGGGGTPQKPNSPVGTPEFSAESVVVQVLNGDLKGLDSFISPKCKGVLADLRDGKATDKQKDELKALFQGLQPVGGRPRVESGAKVLTIKNGEGAIITFKVKKEGEEQRVIEMTVKPPTNAKKKG